MMSEKTLVRTAWALFAICVALYALMLGLTAAYRSPAGDALLVTAFLVTPGVGALVASRHPRNAIGWLLLITGLGFGVAAAANEYTALSEEQSVLLGPEVGVAASPSFFVVLVSGAVLLPLLFPDGRLLSRRWRVVVWVAGLSLFFGAIGYVIKPGRLDIPRVESENPFGVAGADWVLSLGFVLVVVAAILAAWSLILRFLRSRGERRQQMKWFFSAALLMFLSALAGWGLEDVLGGGEALWMPFYILLFFGLPASIGIAILRHRLYDIDRIINRTLTYALLSAALGATYFGLVVGLQALLQPLNGGSDLALAVTTLIVAALFLPAQRRVQAIVDRRFNRRAYDAARIIDAFGARLRDQSDLDTLRYELLAVVDETIAPAGASLWLRDPMEARR